MKITNYNTMPQKLTVSFVRDLLNQVQHENITFSRFVEIMNEWAYNPQPKPTT